MARDASGNYSLASGNPVSSGTTISATWANNTLTDLATEMTDSLSRSGSGAMLAGLEGFAGTVSLPGYAFTDELSTGIYYIATGNVGIALAGVQVMDYASEVATVISAVADATIGPILKLHRNSASPADADFIGAVYFDGEDDGGTQTTFASIEAQIDDVTDATEDGTLLVKTMQAGTLTTVIDISTSVVVTPATTLSTSLTLATGATVTGILDEDAMGTNSATQLATQQSIKAYVDAQVGTVNSLTEVLALGNTTGGTNLEITNGDAIVTTVGNLALTPVAGSAIVLDGTISVDAGVVTGATSITSTAFVGNVTGNASGTAATVTGATQAAITTLANAVTVGALDSGSITSGFGSIDVGSSAIDGGVITADTNFAGNLTGNVTGNTSGTAATVTGGTQASITSAANLVTVGALDSGSITSGFGSIDVGSSAIDGGVITADTNFAGNITGNVTGNTSGTAATVTGATQAAITTLANAVTVGALDSGSITSGFGSIDVGSSAIDGGVITADTNFAGDLTGNVTGNASGTAATVTGGTQASITSAANLVTVGALDSGSITSGFGAVDVGSSAIDGGVITAATNFAGPLTGNVTGNASGSSGTCTGLASGNIGKSTIFVPVAAMLPTVSNGCAAIAQAATGAGQPDMNVLDFDGTSAEYAQFQVAFPKSWNEGTVAFQAFWTSTATDTDGVAWSLQGVAVSNDGTIGATYGTAVVVIDNNISAANDMLVTGESGAITIAGTPAAEDMCYFRIFRAVSNGSDTMAEDARLIGIKLFFTTDAGNDA